MVRGSSQLSAASPPVRIGSNLASVADGNGNSLYGSSAISGFVLDQTASSAASEVPLSGAATNYAFNQPVTATALPAAVGSTTRTTQTLTGYFGGVMNTTALAQPYAITGTTTLSTDATANRVTASFATDAAVVSATGGPSQLQYGGTTGNSAFINDSIYGAAESQPQNAQLYLLSSGAAPPPSAFSVCQQCQYLQWGYWGGDVSVSPTRIDRGGINFWVAGTTTPLTDINVLAAQGAVGNYTGNLIGSVFNNGQQYVAAGGLNASYNFGTHAGSFSVINYDGHSFTATGTPITSGANLPICDQQRARPRRVVQRQLLRPVGGQHRRQFRLSHDGRPDLSDLGDLRRGQALRRWPSQAADHPVGISLPIAVPLTGLESL